MILPRVIAGAEITAHFSVPVHQPHSSAPSLTLRLLSRSWPWLAAILSGVLLGLCFAPWNKSHLCWFSLTPLICALWFSKTSVRRRFCLGWVTGITFFSMTFYWLGALADLYAFPILRGTPFLLAFYLGLYPAAWASLLGSGSHRAAFVRSGVNLATAAGGAALWCTLEWIRGWLFSGFGWNGLGVALHRDLALIQIAEVTGVLGLSFLVAFCNLLAVLVVRRLVAESGPGFMAKIRWEFSLGMTLLAAVFGFGVSRILGQPENKVLSGTPSLQPISLRVAALQPNIPQSEKFSPDAESKTLNTLARLTGLGAASRPDLLLWPESATPRGIFSDPATLQFVQEQASHSGCSLLFGTVEDDIASERSFNSAALFTQRGTRIQLYRKVHLVPFGEYLPLRNTVPLLDRLVGGLVPGDFAAGSEFKVLQLENPPLNISTLICFEDSVGYVARRQVLNGSQLLMNLTNDGWFARSAAAEQHLANAIFRAVENRRPLIRCTNTGMTCSVSPMGRVDSWIVPFSQGLAVREVSSLKAPSLTVYSRWGDWWAWTCAVGSLVSLPFLHRRNERPAPLLTP
jgi:apolipoprotein N-acyltransferase